jgi:hypothetical protein
MEKCIIDFKQIAQMLMAVPLIFFCILILISFFIKDDIPPEEEKKPTDNSLDI